jgi:hypothetical protein
MHTSTHVTRGWCSRFPSAPPGIKGVLEVHGIDRYTSVRRKQAIAGTEFQYNQPLKSCSEIQDFRSSRSNHPLFGARS